MPKVDRQKSLNQLLLELQEAENRIWCDYHYSICHEQSVLGSSNHVIIIGVKSCI